MPQIPNYFVVAMGIGTVFVGLICIIIICKIVGAVCMKLEKGNSPSVKIENINSSPSADINNRQEIIAAVSAAVAEELGKDVSAIKILSFKKIS